MDLGPHGGFIIAAYCAATLILTGLFTWVTLDLKTQRRKLAELERSGLRRRSARASDEGASESNRNED